MEAIPSSSWQCPSCTLLNDASNTACAACFFQEHASSSPEKDDLSAVVQPEAQAATSSCWQCPACTLLNDISSLTCDVCLHERPANSLQQDADSVVPKEAVAARKELLDTQRFLEAISEKSDTFDPLHITSFGVSSAQEARLCLLAATQESGYDLLVADYHKLREERRVRLPLVVGDAVKHEEKHGDWVGTVMSSTIKEDSTETVHVRYTKHNNDNSGNSEWHNYEENAHGDKSFPFDITSLARRHPEEVWLRHDTTNIDISCKDTSPIDNNNEHTCCICLEPYPSSALLSGLCRGQHFPSNKLCEVVYCQDCFARHIEATIAEMRYNTVPLRCPGPNCGRRLAMEVWHGYASKVSLLHYVHTPRQIVTMRCHDCDATTSGLFPRLCTGRRDRQEIYERVFESLSISGTRCAAMVELAKAWHFFSCDRSSPQETIEKFHKALQTPDSMEFTKLLIGSVTRRRNNEDSDDSDQEDEEEEHHLGLLSLVVDVERRAALTLALLRSRPIVEMPCCGAEACFQCKTDSHYGKTCEERQQEQVGCIEGAVQSCPRCGVPTMRSEGCKHIVCVCGGHWDWKDEEDDEES